MSSLEDYIYSQAMAYSFYLNEIIEAINGFETLFKLTRHGWFPVLRFLDLRIRTECSEHVNSFIDAYWAYARKRDKNAPLENSHKNSRIGNGILKNMAAIDANLNVMWRHMPALHGPVTTYIYSATISLFVSIIYTYLF